MSPRHPVDSLRAQARHRLADYVRRHPHLPLRAAEAVGAHTIAGRIDAVRSGGDLVTIPIPPGPRDLRSRCIKMYRVQGRDLIVTALRRGWSQFEAPTLDQFVCEVRHRPQAVIDVGANTGLFSLLAVAVGAAHAYAFEPFPTVAEQLLRNAAENRALRRISLLRVALADFEGVAPLYIPTPLPSDPIESSASLSATFKESVEGSIEVPVTTLDASWASMGRPPVGVIKIDVESQEASVLDGADGLVAAERPVIFYELLPGGDADRIARFAQRHDLVDSYASPVEVVAGERIRHIPTSWNHLLIPREQLSAAMRRFAGLGLKTTVV